ncbi:hypothetical protein NQ315_014255 [Exocentrus adspersus]|uniref:Peptidase A2 domain-containing protein n=1 Tax=Exocentrus adspersus TaxID=1586481 RepID=A0AAV8V9N4_9CUCU|nr:hypothetical protein NQ315_014255 [Exocentrus adspersus]
MWETGNHDSRLPVLETGKLERNCTVARPVPFRPDKASEAITAPLHDNRPHAPVRIYDQTFLALIDTGAARSYIGNRVHQHCDQQGVPNKTATARIIQLANGEVITVDRAYLLEFDVGNTRFQEWLGWGNWDYLPDLLGDVVFGMDILSQHDFAISPATATVRLGNTVVSTDPSLPPNPLGSMALKISICADILTDCGPADAAIEEKASLSMD